MCFLEPRTHAFLQCMLSYQPRTSHSFCLCIKIEHIIANVLKTIGPSLSLGIRVCPPKGFLLRFHLLAESTRPSGNCGTPCPLLHQTTSCSSSSTTFTPRSTICTSPTASKQSVHQRSSRVSEFWFAGFKACRSLLPFYLFEQRRKNPPGHPSPSTRQQRYPAWPHRKPSSHPSSSCSWASVHQRILTVSLQS